MGGSGAARWEGERGVQRLISPEFRIQGRKLPSPGLIRKVRDRGKKGGGATINFAKIQGSGAKITICNIECCILETKYIFSWNCLNVETRYLFLGYCLLLSQLKQD